jgi:hypothetical protein
MSRIHRCDVPGCTRTRASWQRLCTTCYAALPGDLRNRIIETRRHGRNPDWRAACKKAARFLAQLNRPPRLPARHRVTPQQSFAQQQRLLGEHD